MQGASYKVYLINNKQIIWSDDEESAKRSSQSIPLLQTESSADTVYIKDMPQVAVNCIDVSDEILNIEVYSTILHFDYKGKKYHLEKNIPGSYPSSEDSTEQF